MQLQRLTGLERQKMLDELAELMKRDRRGCARFSPASACCCRSSSTSCATCRRKFGDDRRTDDSRGQGGELQHRGPDRRRRRRDHGHRHRLHQAHADLDVPQPEARRQGPHRDADARGGRRQSPVRGVDALLHDGVLGSRPRLLAEGPRDSRRRPRRPRQGDRQPRADGGRREDRGHARRCRSSTSSTSS